MKILFFGFIILFNQCLLSVVSQASLLLSKETNAASAAVAEANGILLQSPSTILSNPSVISFDSTFQCNFDFGKKAGDLKFTSIAFSYRFGKIACGALISNATIDGLERREFPTTLPMGIFNAREYRFGSAIGYLINDNLSIGVNIRHTVDRILDDEQKSTTFGTGLFSKVHNWKLGFSIQEIGAPSSRNQKSTINSEFATQTELPLGLGLIFTPSAKVNYRLQKVYSSIGTDLQLLHLLSVRTGYYIGNDSKSFSYGIGVKWKKYSFDWSFTPYENNLGTSTIVSLMMQLP
ncbi:MAG: hypothetical protein N2450_04180 [bacterium]|nr:hypothetical protein [bacterium]